MTSTNIGMNPESERVLALLDEIKETQNEILAKMTEPNETFGMELARLNSLITNVEHYLPVLKTLATDIVQICERIEALRNRLAILKEL